MNPGYSRIDISNHVQSSCQIMINNGQQTVCNDFNECFYQHKKSQNLQRDSPHRDTIILGSPFSAAAEQSLQVCFGSEFLRAGFSCFYAGCISKKISPNMAQKMFFHQRMATSMFKICRCESLNSSPCIKHLER